MENSLYVHQEVIKIQYDPKLLWKYHEFSKKIVESRQQSNSNLPFTANQSDSFKELMELVGERDLDESIRETEIEINVFNSNHYFDKFSENEILLHHSLLFIVHKYIEHDYRMFFIREQIDEDVSDEQAHKHNKAFITSAYDNLKDLKNLLAMRDNLENVQIVFDLKDDDGKKQSQFQVKCDDAYHKKTLIDSHIESILNSIHHFNNEYFPQHKFAGKNVDNLTLDFVMPLFERVRPLVEYEKKKSSDKRMFKGLLLKVIRDFSAKEQLTVNGTLLDDRLQKVIAYNLMATTGMIEMDLVARHTNRDSRIKYIDSLPIWDNDNYSINIS